MSDKRLSVVSLIVGVVALVVSGFVLVLFVLDYPYFPFQKTIAGHEETIARYGKTIAMHEGRLVEVYDRMFPQFEKVVYEITPIGLGVSETIGDEWGKPDIYIKVYHKGREIIKTNAVADRSVFAQRELSHLSTEVVFKISKQRLASDYMLVQLWDADDFSADDLIASWYVVGDPMKLENLSPSNGSYVKFKVKKGKVVERGREK